MFRMAVGHSDDVDPQDAIAAAIEQCRAGLGGLTPQAGILFSSFDSFDAVVTAAVRAQFPGVRLIGSTSAAQVSSVIGFQEDSIALALFASDSVDITAGMGTGLGHDVEAACKAAVDQASAATDKEPKVCVVLTEAFVVDPQLSLDAIARLLPKGVLLVGGTSARGDFVTVRPTYQLCDDAVATDGVALLLFSGPLAHSIAVGTGWKPLGPKGTVTRSTRGAVQEIDGSPAIEFLKPYLDVTGPSTYGNPFAVSEQGSDGFYLRAIQGSDPESGAVRLAGSVPVGATVQLTTANTNAVLAGTEAALGRAVDAFPSGAQPEAALIFSCSVRKFVLGSRTQVESQLAGKVLGTALPFAGMYCYGEIGPVEGAATSRFLNENFVTVLLGT